jgi:hypothetical protein
MKDLYLNALDAMIDEYIDQNPDADWSEAYDACADGAYDRARADLFDAADHFRKQAKEAT